MSTEEAPARLAFGKTFGATFGSVFGNFWSFVKAALLPIGLSIALTVANLALVAGNPIGLALVAGNPIGAAQVVVYSLLLILGLLPPVILGIACHRLVLLGRRSGAIPRPLLGRRTLGYLGYTVLFTIIAALPVMAFTFMMHGDAPTIAALHEGSQEVQMRNPAMIGGGVLLLFIFYLFYLYFMTRLSLVFPAVAVDRKLGLRGSWRLTRGASGVKLYALLIVIAFIVLIGMLVGLFVIKLATLWWPTPDLTIRGGEINWTAIVISQIPTLIGALVLEFLGFIMILAAVTTAYAQLSGWSAPRSDNPERFA